MNRSLFLLRPLAATLVLLLAVAGLSGTQNALAQEYPRSAQGEARKEMRAGTQLSLREIERRVVPLMRGSQYLGPAYDVDARAYRLKFIRDGRVTYVDVDARTGRIISRSE